MAWVAARLGINDNKLKLWQHSIQAAHDTLNRMPQQGADIATSGSNLLDTNSLLLNELVGLKAMVTTALADLSGSLTDSLTPGGTRAPEL